MNIDVSGVYICFVRTTGTAGSHGPLSSLKALDELSCFAEDEGQLAHFLNFWAQINRAGHANVTKSRIDAIKTAMRWFNPQNMLGAKHPSNSVKAVLNDPDARYYRRCWLDIAYNAEHDYIYLDALPK